MRQVQITKSYGQDDWREDLKRITKSAGAEGKPAMFLFSDTQIKRETFVEDINNLLNSGEVPNMFPYDERAAVMEAARVTAKKEKLVLEGAQELWDYFVRRTQENLHLVICLSPVGDAFRERLRQFPSLVNCCTIDWFARWPPEALQAVAAKFMQDVELPADVRGKVITCCRAFHQVRPSASPIPACPILWAIGCCSMCSETILFRHVMVRLQLSRYSSLRRC